VELDRLGAEEQRRADLTVGAAVGDRQGDLKLLGGELLCRCRRANTPVGRLPGCAQLARSPLGPRCCPDALERLDSLMRAAQTAEATKAEVREAAKAHAKAMEEAADAKALFDAAIGVRLGVVPLPTGPEPAISAGNSAAVQAKVTELQAAHMPYLFPEVFLRDNPGFDVLIGNPPWEKVKVEEHQWWGLRFPGLRSLPQKDKNAAIARYKRERPDLLAEYEAEVASTETIKDVLGRGPFPGLRAATDTDLSLAFAWRFWHLLRRDGRAGVVLPRGILAGRAAAQWRTTILDRGAFQEVTSLSNSRNWMFDDVHPQYTIGLVSIIKGQANAGQVIMRGPYFSLDEYQRGVHRPPIGLPQATSLAGPTAQRSPSYRMPTASMCFSNFGLILALTTRPASGGSSHFVNCT
jgi:hypothetical protein